ncbi:hypothetical protein GQ600_4443 [Phytophthora cactorum]|nr:hypothetical protein GQ600_4443 [Phytophthora cactorum]
MWLHTSHAAHVQWRKLRREYEDEVAMRCQNDTEKMADVLVSVKKSFDKRVLEVWCEFDWSVDIDTVSDEFILEKIDEIISSAKNNSVPDVAALFKKNVVIDMNKSDVKEREFFTGKEGMRLKCKLLVESLEPRSLREEVATIIKYQSRLAKESEKDLFKLILEKAIEQDRDFQRRKRSRGKDQNDRERKENQLDVEVDHPRSKYRKFERGGKQSKKDRSNQGQMKSGRREVKTPPTGGCLKWKGDHWLVHSPTATADEMKELLKEMHERRNRSKTPRRAVRDV